MQVDQEALYKRIGHCLKQRREALSLRQAQIASELGMLRTSITNIEAGRQKAPLHALYQICAILRIEVSDVIPALSSVVDSTPVTLPDQNIPPKTAMLLQKAPPKTAEFIRQLFAPPAGEQQHEPRPSKEGRPRNRRAVRKQSSGRRRGNSTSS